jgi:SAM-dependent methyltransferase
MNWKIRSRAEEAMDDMNLSGPVLENTLKDLSRVHRLLGGHASTTRAFRLLASSGQSPQRIIDVGCGGGDSLISIHSWGEKSGRSLEIVGLDANRAAVEYAKQQTVGIKNISCIEADIFDNNLEINGFDTAYFSLIWHHFSDEEILKLLKHCEQAGIVNIIVNDLHRQIWAYRLFSVATRVFQFSEMARADGLLSIQKGFLREELDAIMKKSNYQKMRLEWAWAFRYLLIAQRDNS